MCRICTLRAPNVRNPHVLFRPFFDKIKARQEKEGRFNTVSWLACGGVSWRFPAGVLVLAAENAAFSAGTVFACRVVSGTKLSGGAGYLSQAQNPIPSFIRRTTLRGKFGARKGISLRWRSTRGTCASGLSTKKFEWRKRNQCELPLTRIYRQSLFLNPTICRWTS